MRLLACASLVAPVALAAACSVAPSDAIGRADVRVESRSAPRIIGGTPSTAAQDATILLVLQDSFCTGTLIAPNLVLTARHCVSQMAGNDECQHFTTDDDPTQMGVVLGVKANDGMTPVAYGTQLFHETDPSGCGQDIALVKLDHDLAGASIAPVRFTPATTSDVGTAIGYGDGDDRGNPTPGRYQRTGVSILAVGPASFTYKTKSGQKMPTDVSAGELLSSESTCFGDSGGPLLDAAGSIIGVTSRGIDDYCVDRPSVWSDVASHEALIENAAIAAGHPLTPPTPPGGKTPGGSSGSGAGGDPGSTPGGDPGATGPGAAGGGIGGGDDGSGGATGPGGDATSHASDATAPAAQSGCSASGAPVSSTGLAGAVVGAALVAATALRRRRRV